ncbi:MAG TPA: aromatic ring-hydroxylating dioxygenase subunit alpha [Steroidobacteraceae bacterium]|nr:aromatic ring-hydroxylating dioxygenase subunit alpha [Steroidobacteraceae bacterium]
MSEHDYLRNAWTMAGWASELDNGVVIARRLLETPVVIFRDSRGVPQALVDRCPHRFAPLSRGKVKGDILECGYHGLGFDGSGKCVKDPYVEAGRRSIAVRRFPVAERDHMIWVWFGDESRADPATIPAFPQHIDPKFRFVFGHSKISAHYELVADNLMDLSHTTFIHPAFGGEFWVPEFSMEQKGDRVVASYRIMDSPPSQFSESFFAAHGRPINEYTTMYWQAPAVMYLDIKWAFSDAPDTIMAVQPSAHVLAPLDKDHSWYFWASGAEQAALITDEDHRAALVHAFEQEDAPMLEACAKSMEGGEFWTLRPVVLPYDRAAIRARQILRRLMREENPTAQLEAVG